MKGMYTKSSQESEVRTTKIMTCHEVFGETPSYLFQTLVAKIRTLTAANNQTIRYQNMCPQGVTNGSLDPSVHMLHSSRESKDDSVWVETSAFIDLFRRD